MVKRTSIIEITKKRYFSRLFILKKENYGKIHQVAKNTFKVRDTKQFLTNFRDLFRLLTNEEIDEEPRGISRQNIEKGTNLQIQFNQLPEGILLVHLAKQLWRNPKDVGNKEIRFMFELFKKKEEEKEWEEKKATRIIVMEENALISDKLGVMSL